ncbi:unnamed protein product [Fusarium venenatum]|uniref:DUF6594 domain-containing protein n=1 Tax=Fusarium venenatum TaxID=56646 RepID=A0A2L2TRF7_9HYPO|nr:uncharacterized protein FVRRES_04229 [Fusarium venenatum]CEI67717.1 unnamed protein product [Fusarium venenatum]
MITVPLLKKNKIPKDKTPLRRLLDSSLRLRILAFWRHREDDVPNYDANHLHYYSVKRMNGFLSAIIVVVGVVMLITPIWVLQATSSFRAKLIVIIVFISAFLVVVSLIMTTRSFEALAATAGNAAVLMIFIQLDGT